MSIMFLFISILFIISSYPNFISTFDYDSIKAKDPWFEEAKFGLFVHWAPISQWGDELSWPLVCESLPCVLQSVNHTYINITTIEELKQHRKDYTDLAKTFNPK